jgi:hypothetical protein
MQEDCRVLIARGNLTGTGGAQAAPGSGATVTIYDSPNDPAMASNKDGVKFERITFSVTSSHDSGASGVVFSSTFDRGANYDTQSSQTYTAVSGAVTYDYLMKGGHVKIAYTNSANVLTAWRYEVFGVFDRNPGV